MRSDPPPDVARALRIAVFTGDGLGVAAALTHGLPRGQLRFADDRQRGRARAWLAARGYRPVRPTSP